MLHPISKLRVALNLRIDTDMKQTFDKRFVLYVPNKGAADDDQYAAYQNLITDAKALVRDGNAGYADFDATCQHFLF